MFKFWGSQEQGDPRPQEVTTNSWYPPSVSTQSPSLPATPNSINSNVFSQRVGDRPHVSPAEAAGIIVYLKDKSVDELRKLLSDPEAYQQFLLSIDPVRTQNNVRDELRKETVQLARENIEKEPQITELRNQRKMDGVNEPDENCKISNLLDPDAKKQTFGVWTKIANLCMIIRTSELASAQEKLNALTKRKAEILKSYSPGSLLHKLQESMNKTDKESETLHQQLLGKEIDLATFIPKYKKLRVDYHKRALTHLAASTSMIYGVTDPSRRCYSFDALLTHTTQLSPRPPIEPEDMLASLV